MDKEAVERLRQEAAAQEVTRPLRGPAETQDLPEELRRIAEETSVMKEAFIDQNRNKRLRKPRMSMRGAEDPAPEELPTREAMQVPEGSMTVLMQVGGGPITTVGWIMSGEDLPDLLVNVAETIREMNEKDKESGD